MTILITAFDPFGGEAINPAWEAVQGLADEIGGAKLIKLQIPTVFESASEVIFNKMKDIEPDVVLCVGQAGGRSALTVEFIGINWQDGRIPDNAGFQPVGEPLEVTGETAYFATLPVNAMVLEMRRANVPAFLSYSAGTYVCNAVLYRVLHHIATNGLNCRAGFIHVPFSTGQGLDKPPGTPTMALETIRAGLEAAVRGILKPSFENFAGSMGQTD